ncbi:MAG TPA: NAD-dependent malic enzyme [Trueperaceae bacterium]|nr:NAD-dependent malic enzyme [Trueperaceae bacterium]
MKQYERLTDDDGNPYLATDLPGLVLTRMPLLNKSTAFTPGERRELCLEGLFPPHISTLEEQVQRTYANFQRFTTNLDKHIYLRVLQDRNEVLFYALIERHLEEMLPIIYTPTVAEAVQKFSLIYRWPRGLVVSTENIDRVEEVLENSPIADVRLVVATDSEGILGIGDQGYGGMAICIGKLSIYTAAAGIDPATTLPIELDVGTNRQDLLDDPLYLGVRHERLTGQAYDDFMERFVTAFKKRFPEAVLQWEDFSKQKAFSVLDRYQGVLPSFNDDIQGTGAVVLAGLLAATRKSRRPLTDETFLVHGAGAGGIGVASQIRDGLIRQGLSPSLAAERIFVVDSRGLVLADRPNLDAYKADLAQDPARVAGWQVAGSAPSLLETVRQGKVTALIGLSGQRGAFDAEIIEAVAANTPSPIIFPLSNPTDYSEAVPEDVYRITDGRAIVATGSPFPEVTWKGVRYSVGQGNNAFIFPGLGLGVKVVRASTVTPGMLSAAAEALAEYTDSGRIQQGAVYPRVSAMRRVSRFVATAVAQEAVDAGVARTLPDGDLADAVGAAMWEARYLPIRRR